MEAHSTITDLPRRGLAGRWSMAAAGRPLFRIRDWRDHFETADMRKYRRLYSVSFPNKHDGKGFARLCARPDRLALFGAFVLTCQLASKAPVRGFLCDEDGPWGPDELAEQCRMMGDEAVFARVLEELGSDRIDWIERATVADLWAAEEAAAAEKDREIAGKSPGRGGSTGRTRENAGKSPGRQEPTGRTPEIPGKSPGSATIPGDSPSHDAIPEDSTLRIGLDRIGSDRTVPPAVPLPGDKSGSPSVPSETTQLPQKKEGGAVASGQRSEVRSQKNEGAGDYMALVEEATARLCAIWGRNASRMGAEARKHLYDWAEGGLLPLPEADWLALRAYYTPLPRPGEQDEKNRRQSAEKMAEHLGAEVDAARRFLGAGVRTAPAGAPAGWQEAAAELGIAASDWETLLPAGKAQIRQFLAVRAGRAEKKEGGAGA